LLRKGSRRRHRPGEDLSDEARDSALHTLDVWNEHLATVGSQLLYARLRLLRDLGPYLAKAYDEVSAGQSDARATYKSSLREAAAASLAEGAVPEPDQLRAELLATLDEVRDKEVERGVSLAGPHRDDLALLRDGGDDEVHVRWRPAGAGEPAAAPLGPAPVPAPATAVSA